MKYSEDILIDIDTYVMRVGVQYERATEPLLLSISFEPEMLVNDMEFSCDVQDSSQDRNIGDMCLRYLHYAHVGGWWLEEEIQKCI